MANNIVVIATRPHNQNLGWVATLKNAGITTLSLPMLQIDAVDESHQIKHRILNLDNYSKLIFVSQNAVQFGFEWIDQYWPQFPIGVTCFTIGTKTGSLINQKLGCNAAIAADKQMTSEELLGREELQSVNAEKILIFRGVGGRPKLADVLIERGASVDYAEVYHRRKPVNLKESIIKSAIRPEKNLLTFFSGETLENYFDAVKDTSLNWSNIPIVVPSERVFELAKKLEFCRVVCAKNASETSMLSAVKQRLSATNE